MAAELITRPFQSSDAEPLISLWQQVLPSTQPWNEPRAELCRKQNQRDELVYVAEQRGEIVGAVIAGYDGVRGWIYRLAVVPNKRRCGIGRQLLEAAETALQNLGCPKVNLQVRDTNAAVIEFYRRCGYVLEERVSLGKLVTGDRHDEAPPTLEVSNQISLTAINEDDRAAYLTHLNTTDEFHKQASLPFPYTEFDVDQWLSQVNLRHKSKGRKVNWAIRESSGGLIGSIALLGLVEGEMAEIGYWLAESHWSQGIITKAIRCVCSFAFDEYRLERIHARVMATNPASARVLTKAGFEAEGTQRKHFIRNGKAVDVWLFGLLRSEL